MSLVDLYNRTVDIERLQATAGGTQEEWSSSSTGVACSIQPVDQERQAFVEGGILDPHNMYCPGDTDIQKGDRVIDGSAEYRVERVEDYSLVKQSGNQHKKVRLSKP